MDVNSINPILQAFAEILPQIGFQEITKKGIALEGATLQNPGILINIGVMGPLTGVIAWDGNARTNPPFPPKTKSPVDARGIQSSESSPNPARR